MDDLRAKAFRIRTILIIMLLNTCVHSKNDVLMYKEKEGDDGKLDSESINDTIHFLDSYYKNNLINYILRDDNSNTNRVKKAIDEGGDSATTKRPPFLHWNETEYNLFNGTKEKDKETNTNNVAFEDYFQGYNDFSATDDPVLNYTIEPCVGDVEYCNYTKEEYMDMLNEYIFPQPYEWVLISTHAIVFVIGLIGNALVCIAVYRNHSMRTVTNYFIVNLAVADFMVILICLPPTVLWDVTETWFFGTAMCRIVLYFQSGNFHVKAKPRSSRPVRDKVDQDQHISSCDIVKDVGTENNTVLIEIIGVPENSKNLLHIVRIAVQKVEVPLRREDLDSVTQVGNRCPSVTSNPTEGGGKIPHPIVVRLLL
ncbi:Orexin receptor type 2 [Eumeta japonica]|uniref:Orexin receptor type 2 n=1 Tax=Eumeta variegata TaxID=151549 RepID=A0A4C1Y3I3_EUMVA|nr:Orexin receptor type 2 [Eumeta japonica]